MDIVNVVKCSYNAVNPNEKVNKPLSRIARVYIKVTNSLF